MAFTHHKWEKSGRHFYDSGTGQFMYQGGLGEQQTWDGLQWLPYLWKSGSNELQYGHRENNIEYASDKQILKVAANIICSSMKIFVQAYVGGEWVNQPHGVPTRNIANDYPVEGRCTGYLDFPDAQLSFGTQESYDLQVGLEVGRSDKAIFGCRLRAPISGQVRFQIVLDELARLPTDWEWIWARFSPFKGKEDRIIGIRFKELEWRWTYEEAPFRTASVETNPNTTKKVTITLGPFDYTANEWLTVYPDQWGETGVSANADDGSEGSIDGWQYDTTNDFDDDGAPCGDNIDWFASAQDYAFAARWLNVAIAGSPTSVDAGTQIEYDVGYGTGDLGDFTFIVYGLEGDCPVFTTTAPSAVTKTTASASFDSPTVGTDKLINGASFQAVIKEILDTSWSSGYDLGTILDKGDASSDAFQIEDGTTGTAARITIVYTPAASSSSSSQSTSISSSSSSSSVSVSISASSSSSSLSISPDGWTWGEETPDPETAVEW